MKKIFAMILVIVITTVCVATAFADFTNMVPSQSQIHSMDPFLLSVFKDGELDVSTTTAQAVYLVTAVLVYMQVNESFQVDTNGAMFFGRSMGRYAGMFKGNDKKYVCILYDTEADTAAWYQLDTGKASEAKRTFETAMPNRDCTEVSASTFSYVVDQLAAGL